MFLKKTAKMKSGSLQKKKEKKKRGSALMLSNQPNLNHKRLRFNWIRIRLTGDDNKKKILPLRICFLIRLKSNFDCKVWPHHGEKALIWDQQVLGHPPNVLLYINEHLLCYCRYAIGGNVYIKKINKGKLSSHRNKWWRTYGCC